MTTKDKEKRKAQNKRYRDAHPETRNERVRNETPEMKQRWNLKTRYDMTPEDVATMLASQDNKCAICSEPLSKYRIDHDHQSGKVRGILCHRCNLLIAGIEDDGFLARAIRYLGREL